MSMISAQIDELRNLAADANINGDTRYFCDPLEQAADTIWELRDDLQRANAENAKLRELVSDLWTHCPVDRYYCSLCEHGNDDGSECKLADRMRELGVEVG